MRRASLPVQFRTAREQKAQRVNHMDTQDGLAHILGTALHFAAADACPHDPGNQPRPIHSDLNAIDTGRLLLRGEDHAEQYGRQPRIALRELEIRGQNIDQLLPRVLAAS